MACMSGVRIPLSPCRKAAKPAQSFGPNIVYLKMYLMRWEWGKHRRVRTIFCEETPTSLAIVPKAETGGSNPSVRKINEEKAAFKPLFLCLLYL
ncbi:MAG: hypothetical protein NVSMB64_00120 [Candidatus Velthaea sp.]